MYTVCPATMIRCDASLQGEGGSAGAVTTFERADDVPFSSRSGGAVLESGRIVCVCGRACACACACACVCVRMDVLACAWGAGMTQGRGAMQVRKLHRANSICECDGYLHRRTVFLCAYACTWNRLGVLFRIRQDAGAC